MDILSVMGATASLGCAILLIAGVLFLDFRRSHRQHRLLLKMRSTLEAATGRIRRDEARRKAA